MEHEAIPTVIIGTGGIAKNHAKALREAGLAEAEAIWLIQSGRAAHDGSFAQFADKVLAQSLSPSQGQLSYTSLRGNGIRFDATASLSEALFVDDMAQPMDNFPHIASRYGGAPLIPATAVEVQYQEHRVRLDFGTTATSSVA